jgi:hypothetical protein
MYVGVLTRRRRCFTGVALRGGLTAVYFRRLGDLAIAIYDCGAFGECDGLARFALSGIGLYFGHVSGAVRSATTAETAFVTSSLWGRTMYFVHKRGVGCGSDVRYQP